MNERWVIESNIKGVLNLSSLKIAFKKNGERVDVVQHTGKSVRELELDQEFNLLLKKGLVITIDKYSENKIYSSNPELDLKLDKILNALSEKKEEEKPKYTNINFEELTESLKVHLDEIVKNKIKTSDGKIVSEEEEKMAEDAMKILIENAKEASKKLDNFGKNKKEIDTEDGLSDFIDF